MAFTEAQLLTELLAVSPQATIISFIPVGTAYTDVYVENHMLTKNKTGPFVQIAQTNTAAQALTLLTAAMS